MAKLPSEDDVLRVLRLNRWCFRDRNILADRWESFAGRSEIALKSGLVWIKFDGIPIHLRSEALFHHLGSICGSVQDVSALGCSWNSVRVKVKVVSALPASISVSFRKETFLVNVSPEFATSTSDDAFLLGWKDKQKGVFIRSSDLPRRGRVAVGDGHLPPTPTTSHIVGFCATRREKGSTSFSEVGETSSGFEVAEGSCDLDKRRDLEVLGRVLQAADPPEVQQSPLLEHSAFCASKVGWEDPTLLLPTLERTPETLPSSFGPAQHDGVGVRRSESEEEDTSLGPFLASAMEPTLEPIPETIETIKIVVGLQSSSPSCAVLHTATADAFEDDVDITLDEEADEVLCQGLLIAESLQLSLEGSREAANQQIKACTEEVLSKKRGLLRKSRQDRELQRIRIDGSCSEPPTTARRRGSSPPPVIPYDY
ncbi:hypothetical protein LINGRAHAP2_LOCUS2299 [Linum grandiflorum]